MDKHKQSLVDKAQELYGSITPCGSETFEGAFTVYEDTLILWINDSTGSTHIITGK